MHIPIKFHEDLYLMVTEVCCVFFLDNQRDITQKLG